MPSPVNCSFCIVLNSKSTALLVFTLFSLLAAAQQLPLPPIPPPPKPASSTSSTLQNRLTQLLPQINSLKSIGGTAGISIGVTSHTAILLETHLGYSNIDRHLTATSSTRYPIASLTKAFVASTIAQLVHEGLLDWNEPLTSYIPDLAFEHNPSLANQLTLTDILCHRTGLARLDALWLGADSQTFTPQNFTITLCNHLPSVHPLRSTWLYNNWMYALAGEVIEKITNQSWGKVLSSRILNPLKLSHTTVIKSEIPQDSLALPYMVLDDKTPVQVGKMGLTDGSIMTSAGGMRSTVSDLLTWGNTLLSLYRDGEEPPLALLDTVLSGHSFMNSTAAADELYALGFAKVVTPAQFGKIGFNSILMDAMPVIGASSKPQQVFYHSGAGAGYNHCFMLVPGSQTVIVVLTNSVSQGDTADWIAQTLLQAVLDEKHPLDLTSFAERAAVKWRATHQEIVDALEKERKPNSPEPRHDSLLGKYWHKSRALYLGVYSDRDDGTLKFSINGKPEQEHVLSHYSDDTFIFLPSADQRLRSGLFHYGPEAWLLHFDGKDSSGMFTEIRWNIDSQAPSPERFVREES
ncbi:beta-lactamase/transpeptidase-like protein [Trichoderma longibrachiatum ATCC 18648]|uniref:Beta-lactamase/transpeptidase-like protein n=1 Tax=Trichoderma longibrachiatum ATCC 18648 TaxID=983965 RepID=A0A2T4CGK1_TRILO|nr:beta-lactamase/transpeptidase-like protein [Trichoderma longibrachiatum ATCC 18648]